MNSIIDPIRLVQGLLAGLSERLRSQLSTRAELTSGVLGALADMGRAHGFAVYHSDRARRVNEFLLDLVWLSPGRMELAVESEWGRAPHVQDDFEKLLHVKCPLKLLVCNTTHCEPILLPKLEAYLARYGDHRLREQYVVLDLRTSVGSAQCFCWMPPCEGHVPEDQTHFSAVDGSPFPYALADRAVGGSA